MLSGRSLVRGPRCRVRDRPSRRGRSDVPAQCVAMAIPTARHSARPALLHYRCCWRPPHPTARHPPASKLSRWLCAGKHSLVNAPARHKTGTDRPSGGLQAADHSWCQSRQGGLCSTPIDTIPSGSSALPLGDAYLARDALAPQGLAIGIAHAIRSVSALANGEPIDPAPEPLQLELHRRRVEALIADSPFAVAAEWQSYYKFLCARHPSLFL